MEKRPLPTLENELRKLSLGRGALFLAIILMVAVLFFGVFSKKAEEFRLKTLSQSAARAFRPRILEQAIRDVQEQMKVSLALENGESVVIRAPNLEEIYSSTGEAKPAKCLTPEKVCWTGFTQMTYLQPVYFSPADPTSLFGYVEVSIKPKIDIGMGIAFVAVLLSFSLFSVFMLFRATNRISALVKMTLTQWSDHLRQSMSIAPVQPIAIPYREFSEPGKLIGSLYREIEESRRRSAEDAHLLGQLSVLRGVGHDLKTPISQIRKFYEVLAMKFERTGIFDRQAGDEMKGAVERVSTLLGEINRTVQGNPSEESSETVDLGESIRSYLHSLHSEPDFKSKNITVSMHAPIGEYYTEIAPVQFYRVFDNLIRNAIDALTGRPGKIKVTLGLYGGSPTIIVADNGSGIESTHIGRIFDPNFTTKASRGTGLGLSIVRKIVEEVGGSVVVESIPGEGASFRIQFRDSSGSTKISVGENERTLGVV